MNPTPSQQLDAATGRIALPKATRPAAREFASLLAQFDGAHDRATGGEATATQDPVKVRPSGNGDAATTARTAEVTTGRTADAAARTTPDATMEKDGAANHAGRVMRRAGQAFPTPGAAQAEAGVDRAGEAEDPAADRHPAGRGATGGLSTAGEVVARIAAHLPHLAPIVAPRLANAASEAARATGQQLPSDRSAASGPGHPAGANLANGQPGADDGPGTNVEPGARERLAQRLGPLGDRIDRHVARGEVRPAQPGNLPGKPHGQVSVTRLETHLAPVRQPSAIAEHVWRRIAPELKAEPRPEGAGKAAFAAVADQVSQALDGVRGELQAKLQQATQQTGTPPRPLPPVKIVEISLQPASLGAIAITMRLTGTGLRLTVAATTRETADTLREDRGALAALIADAGYDASEIIVTHRPPRDPQTAAG